MQGRNGDVPKPKMEEAVEEMCRPVDQCCPEDRQPFHLLRPRQEGQRTASTAWEVGPCLPARTTTCLFRLTWWRAAEMVHHAKQQLEYAKKKETHHPPTAWQFLPNQGELFCFKKAISSGTIRCIAMARFTRPCENSPFLSNFWVLLTVQNQKEKWFANFT